MQDGGKTKSSKTSSRVAFAVLGLITLGLLVIATWGQPHDSYEYFDPTSARLEQVDGTTFDLHIEYQPATEPYFVQEIDLAVEERLEHSLTDVVILNSHELGLGLGRAKATMTIEPLPEPGDEIVFDMKAFGGSASIAATVAE